MPQEIIVTNTPASVLAERLAIEKSLFIIADSNTARLVVPSLVAGCHVLRNACIITIPAGDENKNITTLSRVWAELSSNGATRASMFINVGGGMVTDLGGMAAATFKRGIRFINLPTTLLGAVDAAVGGKTGINFGGLKNEIGVFRQADTVILSSCYFNTLSPLELASGYAEIIKHALIDSSEALDQVLRFDLDAEADSAALLDILARSVEVKRRIVAEDPCECGLRKALNLGHTVGHALESLAMERHRPVPHGVAVAWGLITSLVLSHMVYGFPASVLHRVADYVGRYYPVPALTCADYPRLVELMRHDKKNSSADAISFTLLEAPGALRLDTVVAEPDILASLDILRDLLHI